MVEIFLNMPWVVFLYSVGFIITLTGIAVLIAYSCMTVIDLVKRNKVRRILHKLNVGEIVIYRGKEWEISGRYLREDSFWTASNKEGDDTWIYITEINNVQPAKFSPMQESVRSYIRRELDR